MEYCSICNSDYKKAFKSDHYKSVKHLEKLNQYYCKKCNLYTPLSDKSSHLSSDEHKNKTKQQNIWCEDCEKYITDKTRHFQSEIHKLKSQIKKPQITITSGLIVNENTYIKYKIYDNFEQQIEDILSQKIFPKFKYQVSYLAKFTKQINNIIFRRWVKSDMFYNFDKINIHETLIEKLDDEELEGSGFQFQYIEEAVIDIYKISDIKASSWVELPPNYKNSKSIINIKNEDNLCFLWCILAYLFPVIEHKNRTSNYSMHINKLNLDNLEFPMKVKDIPKFERKNNLNINVFELTNNILSPIYINNNYNEPQIDLLLYENHYCLITKLHSLLNKDSHMQHVCRRCLTAFISQHVLIDHIERCIYQKPTNIKFSYKDHLKFEDHYMKIPVSIRIYADFECINQYQNDSNQINILFKQIPIAVGFYLISPSGNQYSSYFGIDCVKWFVNQMLKLNYEASKYFKTIIPVEMSPEEEKQFQESNLCWLCEKPFEESVNLDNYKVIDYNHITGKYRGTAHNICKINCKQTQLNFVPIIFHNFSGYDCHIIFEELLSQSFAIGIEPKIIPKSLENYVSVQVGYLRFLDSYRFLSYSLQKLIQSLSSFPYMNINQLEDPLFKQKLAYPYEKFNLNNINDPLNLSKDDYWSTLKQKYIDDEDIKRTNEIVEKFKIKTGKDLTMLYLKMDIIQLVDVFENFVEKSTSEYGINPLTVIVYQVIHGK